MQTQRVSKCERPSCALLDRTFFFYLTIRITTSLRPFRMSAGIAALKAVPFAAGRPFSSVYGSYCYFFTYRI